MASGADKGQQTGNAIKEGVARVHGVGEAIRGNINSFVDQASGDRASAARNAAVANKGMNEINTGQLQRDPKPASTGTTTTTTTKY